MDYKYEYYDSILLLLLLLIILIHDPRSSALLAFIITLNLSSAPANITYHVHDTLSNWKDFVRNVHT